MINYWVTKNKILVSVKDEETTLISPKCLHNVV